MSSEADHQQIKRDLAQQAARERIARDYDRSDTWIDRVRAADAEAETRWLKLMQHGTTQGAMQALALIAIAAELRAARIARRPGAGQ
jgi:hypothetical protein